MNQTLGNRPLRVLFLCTGNSARSQIAEALLREKGGDRFQAASAGSHPAERVHPLTVKVLAECGIDWSGRTPKGIDAAGPERWDFVITVCDRAKESCPIFPGQPVFAHWGMADPSEPANTEDAQLRAFRDTVLLLSRRIDLMLSLPIERLQRRALEERLRAIGAPPARAE